MKNIILLAGYPATGKTYMSNIIKEQYPKAMYISQDSFKELLYDTIGFNNIEQKNEIVEMSRTMFYDTVKLSVLRNNLIMLDYPFSYKQRNFLNGIKEKFDVNIMTVRLVGDLDTLYDRRVKRDILPDRNKGHILDSYHGYETYNEQNYPLTREKYKQNCINGKYDEFEFGKLIKVDVTVYENINYPKILKEIESELK